MEVANPKPLPVDEASIDEANPDAWLHKVDPGLGSSPLTCPTAGIVTERPFGSGFRISMLDEQSGP